MTLWNTPLQHTNTTPALAKAGAFLRSGSDPVGRGMRALLAPALLLATPVTAMADGLTLAVGSWGVVAGSPGDNATQDELDYHRDLLTRACESGGLQVSIDREALRYTGILPGEDFVTSGDILDHGPDFITLRYDDETRTMNDGSPQIWHMVFTDDDMFFWVLGHGRNIGERDGVVAQPRLRCNLLLS